MNNDMENVTTENESKSALKRFISEPIYLVPQRQSMFGSVLDTRLNGTLIVMVRTILGLKIPETLNYVMLPHQLYAEKIEHLCEEPNLEVIAIDIDNGQRITVWAESEKEILYPKAH